MKKKRNTQAEGQQRRLKKEYLKGIEREDGEEQIHAEREAARHHGQPTDVIAESGLAWLGTVYYPNKEIPFDGGTAKTRAEAVGNVKDALGDGGIDMPASPFDSLWVQQYRER